MEQREQTQRSHSAKREQRLSIRTGGGASGKVSVAAAAMSDVFPQWLSPMTVMYTVSSFRASGFISSFRVYTRGRRQSIFKLHSFRSLDTRTTHQRTYRSPEQRTKARTQTATASYSNIERHRENLRISTTQCLVRRGRHHTDTTQTPHRHESRQVRCLFSCCARRPGRFPRCWRRVLPSNASPFPPCPRSVPTGCRE